MGTTHVRRLRAAPATALACVLLLAGCGGDDPAPIVADPTPSASATPTPTASAAPQPWEERSKAGAVAFVEHWVEVFNDAGASGQTEELRLVSARDCVTCNGAIRLIDDWSAEGSTLTSAGWEVVAAQIPTIQRRPPFDVAVRIRRSPQVLRAPDGSVQRFPGSTETYNARVSWSAGRWSLVNLNQVT